jgi:hypothetical protein
MLPDFGPIEEAIREWARAAGVHVDQVVLRRRRRAVLVLPLTARDVAAEPRADVGLQVLGVLRQAGRPMTGFLILDTLDQQGVRVGKSTLDRLLAKMVAEGDLLNPPGAKPPGYRLPTE